MNNKYRNKCNNCCKDINGTHRSEKIIIGIYQFCSQFCIDKWYCDIITSAK